MAIYLLPHSPEWFDALEAFNPLQAAMTRAAIQAAGNRTDVCSVCGDDPALDFKLVGEQLLPDAVATIRLCDDCRSIPEQAGEAFASYP